MADEVQIKDAVNYPEWKKVAWRFLRTAIAGGASTVIAVSVVLRPDLSNIQEYGYAIVAAFIAGFIGALGKIIRNVWGEETKDSIVDKITLF